MTRLFLLLALVAGTLLPAQALETTPIRKRSDLGTWRHLVALTENTRLSVDWKDVPFREVTRHLARTLGINLIIDRTIGEKAEEPVTLTLVDVKAATVLAALKDSMSVTFLHRDGMLHVTTTEDATKRSLMLELIDVRDILYVPPDFPAPSGGLGINPGPPVPPVAEEEPPEQKDPDFVLDLVRTSVSPKSWDIEGTSLQISKGTLIVRNTPRVIAEVRSFLTRLRGVY